MTIIAGFKSYEGIVICADTQETSQGFKRNLPKLRIEPSDGSSKADGLAAAFCGAGENGPFIDKLINVAWEEIQMATSLDEACLLAESAIKKTYREFGRIYQPGACPTADLIFGIKMFDGSKLFTATGPIVNEKHTYDSAGAGYYMADFLAARMYRDYLQLRQLVILAAYVLFQAKEHVDGCGGESHIAVLSNEGHTGKVESARVDALTEVLGLVDSDVAQVLLSTGDLSLSRRDFRKSLRRLTASLETFRSTGIDKFKAHEDFMKLFFRDVYHGVDEIGVPKTKRPRRSASGA